MCLLLSGGGISTPGCPTCASADAAAAPAAAAAARARAQVQPFGVASARAASPTRGARAPSPLRAPSPPSPGQSLLQRAPPSPPQPSREGRRSPAPAASSVSQRSFECVPPEALRAVLRALLAAVCSLPLGVRRRAPLASILTVRRWQWPVGGAARVRPASPRSRAQGRSAPRAGRGRRRRRARGAPRARGGPPRTMAAGGAQPAARAVAAAAGPRTTTTRARRPARCCTSATSWWSGAGPPGARAGACSATLAAPHQARPPSLPTVVKATHAALGAHKRTLCRAGHCRPGACGRGGHARTGCGASTMTPAAEPPGWAGCGAGGMHAGTCSAGA